MKKEKERRASSEYVVSGYPGWEETTSVPSSSSRPVIVRA